MRREPEQPAEPVLTVNDSVPETVALLSDSCWFSSEMLLWVHFVVLSDIFVYDLLFVNTYSNLIWTE